MRCEQEEQLLDPRWEATGGKAQFPAGQTQVDDGHAEVLGETVGQEGELEGLGLQEVEFQIAQIEGLVDQTHFGHIPDDTHFKDFRPGRNVGQGAVGLLVVRVGSGGGYRGRGCTGVQLLN